VNHEIPAFITQDPAMQGILRTARQVAPYNSNIQITGESGTGKDLLAAFIHSLSPRHESPFVTIDLSSTPESLLESELFGHVRGAFSSAHQDREGRLKAADGGTIYLDHVNELNATVQSKLTRVLQERHFEPVGSNTTISVDVRFIASSRLDLGNMVRKNLFREDLFFRLSIIPIHIPPLRQRLTDIPLLAKHFIEKYSTLHSKVQPKIDTETLDILCAYHWPGNVRELQNQMERIVISSDGKNTISPAQLNLDFDFITDTSLETLADQNLSLEQIEKLYIQKILLKTRGNKSKASRILGINRKTLLEKRKRHHLD